MSEDEGPHAKRRKVVSSPTGSKDAAELEPAADPEPVVDFKHTSGPYTLREEFLIAAEKEGSISFHYVENNGDPQNMIWLVGLKNIFSKQLPNMPKEYICKLVFDRRHRSVALVKPNGSVVGGITYRAFHKQGFGEIAFCAITASEQVKGYGTRLMNHTKEFARVKDKLTHFLTYADNNAVGYFSKQGFTKEVTLEKERWVGFIKDYDGGTLMEFAIHSNVCYITFPDMIKRQRAALDAEIRQLSNSHVVYPGLQHFHGSKRTQAPIESISGVKEAGWTPETSGSHKYKILLREGMVEPTQENLFKFMQVFLKEVKKQEEAWPFAEPVNPHDVLDYYDVINDPVDLTLIEKRLNSQNYYLTLDIYRADFKRMFNNCRYYNSSDTVYYKLANKLEAFLEDYFASHVVLESSK